MFVRTSIIVLIPMLLAIGRPAGAATHFTATPLAYPHGHAALRRRASDIGAITLPRRSMPDRTRFGWQVSMPASWTSARLSRGCTHECRDRSAQPLESSFVRAERARHADAARSMLVVGAHDPAA